MAKIYIEGSDALGFASNKDEVGGFYCRLSQQLANQGIASLRIDFRGWGESEYPMTSSDLKTMTQDAILAYKFILEQSYIDKHRIAICGFSLGAYISLQLYAALTREMFSDTLCSALVLLSPCGDPLYDLQTELKYKSREAIKNIIYDQTIVLDGEKSC